MTGDLVCGGFRPTGPLISVRRWMTHKPHLYRDSFGEWRCVGPHTADPFLLTIACGNSPAAAYRRWAEGRIDTRTPLWWK